MLRQNRKDVFTLFDPPRDNIAILCHFQGNILEFKTHTLSPKENMYKPYKKSISETTYSKKKKNSTGFYVLKKN